MLVSSSATLFTFGRLTECLRPDLRPRNNWNYWNGWNSFYWNKLLSGVFKAREGLNPEVNPKILSESQTLLRDLKPYSLGIGRFERLEESAVVERLERAAVIR